MNKKQNRQWRLVREPVGLPKRSDFEFVTCPMPVAGPDEVVIRHHYISLDPGLRFFMNASLYHEGSQIVPLGGVMRGWAVGQVEASNSPRFPVGTFARDNMGWAGFQVYSCTAASGLVAVDPDAASLPRHLGALGMTGLTAYFGMMDIGRPKPGETVVVSGAAGAVGSVAAQIAQIHGCRVIGLAGGRNKCGYLRQDLALDAAIDYKSEDIRDAIQRHCPKGIDIYFDNVGGEILDTCLAQLAQRARIVSCGVITSYNADGSADGISNYTAILLKEARWEGYFVISPRFVERYAEAIKQMSAWLRSGQLKSREDVALGLENFPEALLRLFSGENNGKLVLKVDSA